jgi:hypothetical protein
MLSRDICRGGVVISIVYVFINALACLCVDACIEIGQQSDGVHTELGRIDDGAAAAGFKRKWRFSRRGIGSKSGLGFQL